MNTTSFSSAKEVRERHLELGLGENFCVAPFTTLLFEPDGSVGACRHKGSEYPIGNIFTQSFDEIWNGPALKQWRQEFIDGQPGHCRVEVKDRKCHHCPEYNALLPSTQIDTHQLGLPKRIAFNFNGKCNLECQMCHIWQKPNGNYEKYGLWEKLESWIGDLEEVELLSGEPFIQKDTYRLIRLLSEKKPKAAWTITTNANWKLTDYVKSQLDQIVVKNIIVSIDSLNAENYAKIRRKGDLQQALQTLRDLHEYSEDRIRRGLSSLSLRVNFLFQKDNWQELGRIDEFEKKEGFSCFRTFLYEPKHLSLLDLSEFERKEILSWYLTNVPLENLQKCWRVLRPLMDSLPTIEKVNFLDQWQTQVGRVL